MVSNDPYLVMIRNEAEQRWRRAAQARLLREAEEGRKSGGRRSARLPFMPGRLRRFAVRVLGLTPAAGVS
jgi:hypothetical protein